MSDIKPTIPVCFSCRRNFIQQLVVAITSILENNSSSFVFYILQTDFGAEEKELLQEIADIYKNAKFVYLDISLHSFDGLKVTDKTRQDIPLATYYRYIAAELIPEQEKLLYLDCDLVVNGNILPLYQIELGEYYFAGVEEIPLYDNGYIYKKLGFSKKDIYINAGVLLMNLKALRKARFFEQFVKEGRKLVSSVLYGDQDILNVVARGKIKSIDCIYNMTPSYMKHFPKKKYAAVIAHYVGREKPWTLADSAHELAFLYFRYLEKSVLQKQQKVKNFCVYHKPFYRFQTDMVVPVQTGTINPNRGMDMLQASSGESIDDKNANYGELTAWYWVYKNYLPKHPEVEYVGFCHYRRMLDYTKQPKETGFFLTRVLLGDFVASCNDNYSARGVYDLIKGYDIVLPKKHILPPEESTNETQYLHWHPKKDLDLVKQLIREDYPEYVPEMDAFFASKSGYYCLLFTMRREIFISFMKFAFDLLFKLEKRANWKEYHSYYEIRTPAFLIERLFNVWLEHNRKKYNWKILERTAYVISASQILPSEIRIGQKISLIKFYCQYLKFRILSKVSFGEKRGEYLEKKKVFKNTLHVLTQSLNRIAPL